MEKDKYILKKKNGYFIFDIFNKRNVLALFSIKPRTYKPISTLSHKEAIENRKWLCRIAGLEYKKLVYPNQKHSTNIYVASVPSRYKESPVGDFDGLITLKKNLSLAIFTADCLPIFFMDERNAAIALAHAGWRGTHKKIAQKVVYKLKRELHTKPEDIIVGFGPCLRSCCYEVSGEFNKLFPRSTIRKGARYYFDLIGENIAQLTASGIKEENIFDSEFCTSCNNELFFSYRKEGKDCGRTISVMALR